MDTLLMMNEYLPLRDVVFNTLRQAILRGELKPGERLLEIQLSKQLGVSRTPVREAIRKLELEGLVIMIPRRGAEVADITEKSLKDVLEVRKALEELAVQLACEKMQPEEIALLKKESERFREVAATNPDVTAVAEADVRFHEVIYNATGNQKLISLLNNLREQMYRFRVEFLKRTDVYQTVYEEHEELVRYIEAKDKDAASKATSIHIDNQVEGVIDTIR
ncbi:MAG: GntR family transcriptional regulator, partial [Dorea sp.]|nr:GntR family transcriptional regulator [Dorea sp.]